MIELEPGHTYKVRFRGRRTSQRIYLRRTFVNPATSPGFNETYGPCLVFEYERARNHPAPDRYRMLADVLEIECER